MLLPESLRVLVVEVVVVVVNDCGVAFSQCKRELVVPSVRSTVGWQDLRRRIAFKYAVAGSGAGASVSTIPMWKKCQVSMTYHDEKVIALTLQKFISRCPPYFLIA